jgi:uncharacterized membrane protein
MRHLRWFIPLVGLLLLLALEEWLSAYYLWNLARDFSSLYYGRPHWLWLLLLIPVLVLFSVRDVTGRWALREWGRLLRARKFLPALGKMTRDLTSMGIRATLILLLRSAVLALIILALAEPLFPREEEELTVMVVIDRSLSIPQEIAEGSASDVRWEKLKAALQKASKRKRPHRINDRIGIISFAKQPRLEYPASSLPEIGVPPLGQGLDRNFTDIAAALRLALASFPQGSARRIILISDGNENRGDALAEARIAEMNGVPIDVIPLKFQASEEIMVDRIDVPSEAPPGQDIPMRLIMHNYANRPVTGTLRITRTVGKQSDEYVERGVKVSPGPYEHFTNWPARLGTPGGVMVYRAVFLPDRLAGDRTENNEATAPVILTQGGRRYLVVHPPEMDQAQIKPLRDALLRSNVIPGVKPCVVELMATSGLPSDKDNRRFELANYDSIILFNVPADVVNKEQQEALRKNVHDQGTGLVVVGGKESFGAGRWQNEPLEAALPVDTAIRSKKVQVKAGLVLIMHASEMPEGNYWQKEIAKLAVEKLGPQDEVGIIYWDWSKHVWHVPLQEIGPNRRKILGEIDTMSPGDMPQFDPAITMATDSLSEVKRRLGSAHVILISDGDHGLLTDRSLLKRFTNNPAKLSIGLTTVGITTHGPAAHQRLAAISAGLGRHHAVDDPEKLPAIYIQELKTISQNYILERTFRPRMTKDRGDPLLTWVKPFPALHGFVRTSRKDPKNVQVLLDYPEDDDDNPILAQWQYGLGRVVAFTSDAGGTNFSWARDWLAAGNQSLYDDFWHRVVEWSQRNIDDTGLSLRVRSENGKIRVHLIDNRTREQRERRPLGTMKVTISSSLNPEGKTLTLDPTAAGVYEAEMEGEAAGSYAVTVSGKTQIEGKDVAVIYGRAAVAVPYSPEFSTVKDNAGLLQQIAEGTKGRVIPEDQLADTDLYFHDGSREKRHQEVWHWLLFAAAVLLFFDVALRRIALDPWGLALRAAEAWKKRKERRALSGTSQEYFDRLKTRKAAVGEKIGQEAATPPAPRPVRPQPTAPPPMVELAEPPPFAADAPPVLQPPPTAPKPKPAAPPPQAPAEDFATRLMKAKKKARERLEGEEEQGR